MRNKNTIRFIFLLAMVFSSCVDEQILVDNIKDPNGKIFIDSQPRGAKIFFLGTDTGKLTPDSIINLESGTYDVTLKLTEYIDTTFMVTVLNEYKSSRLIEMQSVFAYGSIYVNSQPEGAQIFFNESYTGKITPDSLLDVTPGSYNLMLKLEGFRDTTINVSIVRNTRTYSNVILKDTLPPVDALINYTNIQFNQILFSFEFNQDIRLDRIESTPPGADTAKTDNFGNEVVLKGDERIIILPTRISGNWSFVIHGSKVNGDKKEFILNESLNVP